jgi:hypothetical protein
MRVTNGRADNMSGTSEVPQRTDPLCATRKSAEAGHERTNAAAHASAPSSARRRNPAQYVPEDTVLQLKSSRAVVLVVSRGDRDNEIELRDDAD